MFSLGRALKRALETNHWAGFDRPYGRRKVALPTYPFQRQRYWIDTRPGGADSTEYSPAQRDAVPPPELVPDDLHYGIEWLPKPHAAFDETSAVLRTNGHGAPRDGGADTQALAVAPDR